MNNPVYWFEIYVDDMPRARKFYEAVFGSTLTHMPSPDSEPDMEMWTFPSDQNTAGCGGALVRMPGFPTGENSVLVYFRCDDCAVEQARVTKAGGKIEKPKFAIGQYGFIALVYDSEGNMIGLHSLK